MKHALIAAYLIATLALAGNAHAQAKPEVWIGIDGSYEDYGQDLDGVTGGLSLGFDYVFSNQWLVGVAARGTAEGVDHSEESTTGGVFRRTETEIDDQWGLSARVGYVFASRWVAFAQVEYDEFDVVSRLLQRSEVCAPPTGCTTESRAAVNEQIWGGAVGLEFAATENVRLRANFGYGELHDEERTRANLTVAWKF